MPVSDNDISHLITVKKKISNQIVVFYLLVFCSLHISRPQLFVVVETSVFMPTNGKQKPDNKETINISSNWCKEKHTSKPNTDIALSILFTSSQAVFYDSCLEHLVTNK